MVNFKIDWHDRLWCIHGDDGTDIKTEEVLLFAPSELRNVNGHGWLFVENAEMAAYDNHVEIYKAVK